MSKKFSWDTAPAWVTRGMLQAAYRSRGRDDDADEVDRLKRQQLVAKARLALGEPPHKRFFDKEQREVHEWLLWSWLPRAQEATVVNLTQMVQASLGGEAKKRKFRSKSGMVKFLQQRNVTTNLMANVRAAFISSYKVEGKPKGPSSTPSSAKASWIPLEGEGRKAKNPPYQHQQDAWANLDDAPRPIRGTLTLPTGAGKTDTLAVWLLGQMHQDPDLRVLWIAHQQELVDQALRRFQNLSYELPPGFNRRARVIHSAGSAPSTLADDHLDLVGITVQSLLASFKRQPAALKKFLGRPTFVVVDEAHHVGSDSYAQVIGHLIDQPTCRGIVGLTATPYPTSPAAASRFHKLFPTTLLEVSREDLIEQRILARPRLHIVDTPTRILLSASEKQQATAGDLPPDALKRVQKADRDSLLVRIWQRDRKKWAKTLVFATSIEHAEQIRDLFDKAEVPARSLHSQSSGSTAETLDWFSQTEEPCVLISVGMLTEGVDLPDASTAFLARPTTSRILMQQMIGRVLRGPTAKGAPVAHLVYLRDHWDNFGDVLEPPEVIEVAPEGPTGTGPERPLPPVISDDGSTELPPQVAATIERLMNQARNSAVLDDDDTDNDRSLDPQLTASALAGYYDLGSSRIPVFEHQLDGFRVLLNEVDWKLQGYGLLSFFDGTPPPFPTRRMLRELVDYAREFERPQFVELHATIGPGDAAATVIKAGSISPQERRRLIEEQYESSLNRHAWASFAHFEQAVDAAIRRQLDGSRGFDPEGLRFAPTGTDRLPRKRRALKPLVDRTLEQAREILPPELADRLTDPPPVYWTRRVTSSTWGHWTIALGKKGAGRQQIRINRIMRTDPKLFPDEAVEYLLFHELLHHLLPGQGHDAEFRTLEARWPESTRWDEFFDTFHEKWDTDPKRYTGESGGPRDID